MQRAVLGIVDTPAAADTAVRRLVVLGLPRERISVLFPDRQGEHDFAFEAATKAPEGAITGVALGAVLGAMVGMALTLAGMFPEVAMLGRTAPVLVALAGAAIGGVALGIAGAIAGATMPEIEAKHYAGKITVGTILVGVHAQDREEVRRAREVFRTVAASHVHAVPESALPVSP